MENVLAVQMWVWVCPHCRNEQTREDEPKFNGESQICTSCNKMCFVAPFVKPPVCEKTYHGLIDTKNEVKKGIDIRGGKCEREIPGTI